jgi:DNA-binding MarR family transcriptional regulator
MVVEADAAMQESRTVMSILRASERIRRHLFELVEPWGLTLQQYNVLRILGSAGEEGLPTLEVRRRMVEKTPGVTRLLDRLEALGWVSRKRSKQDRRIVYCRATRKAQALLDELAGPVTEVDRVLTADLRLGEQLELEALLNRIRS